MKTGRCSKVVQRCSCRYFYLQKQNMYQDMSTVNKSSLCSFIWFILHRATSVHISFTPRIQMLARQEQLRVDPPHWSIFLQNIRTSNVLKTKPVAFIWHKHRGELVPTNAVTQQPRRLWKAIKLVFALSAWPLASPWSGDLSQINSLAASGLWQRCSVIPPLEKKQNYIPVHMDGSL